MKRLQSHLAAAGLTSVKPTSFLVALSICGMFVGVLLTLISEIPSFFAMGLVFTTVAAFEFLRGLSQRRESALVAALPEMAEQLATVLAAGVSLPQSLTDLATSGPRNLRKVFSGYSALFDKGYPLGTCLDWLKSELANAHADQIIELLSIAAQSGGRGIVVNLNAFAQTMRAEILLRSELQAKQGWVLGTAKVAVLAPWLIAVLLSRRPEALAYYSSNAGSALLIAGLVTCGFAYWLIGKFAGLRPLIRVFAR